MSFNSDYKPGELDLNFEAADGDDDEEGALDREEPGGARRGEEEEEYETDMVRNMTFRLRGTLSELQATPESCTVGAPGSRGGVCLSFEADHTPELRVGGKEDTDDPAASGGDFFVRNVTLKSVYSTFRGHVGITVEGIPISPPRESFSGNREAFHYVASPKQDTPVIEEDLTGRMLYSRSEHGHHMRGWTMESLQKDLQSRTLSAKSDSTVAFLHRENPVARLYLESADQVGVSEDKLTYGQEVRISRNDLGKLVSRLEEDNRMHVLSHPFDTRVRFSRADGKRWTAEESIVDHAPVGKSQFGNTVRDNQLHNKHTITVKLAVRYAHRDDL